LSTNSQDEAPKIINVSNALETFEPIQNYIVSMVLRYLPLVILLFAVVVTTRCLLTKPLANNLADTISYTINPFANTINPSINLLFFYSMFYSALLSSAISLLLFSSLMKRISYTLGTLWDRKIIGFRDEAFGDSEAIKRDLILKTNLNSPSKLEKQYVVFICKFQDLLNHPYQWVFALAFSAFVFTWHDYEYSYDGQIIEHLVAFVIGFMAWRMIIIGVQVWQLGRKFDINPQLGHPDECGGLAPLGNLCLWNGLILSILGIFLGGWIIIGPGTRYHNEYTIFYTKLLLITVGWAVVSFFFPLWSVHRVMVAKREEIQLKLNKMGQRINQLSHEILDRCHELEPEESEKIAKKLAILQQTYLQHENYPVWPFNADIIKKLALSQTVQLLSLTGLGQPILNGFKIIVEILKGLSQ
jgi:hypothetical protein